MKHFYICDKQKFGKIRFFTVLSKNSPNSTTQKPFYQITKNHFIKYIIF